MKKRGRILVLLMTAMLAAEPMQMVYAESAGNVANVSGSVTDVNPGDGTNSVVPIVSGWVKAAKGYQYRQADGTFIQKSGWVTIEGKKYYL